MTKYSSMPMGEALVAHPSIHEKKTFFGLKKEAYYAPTNSIIKGYDFYPTEGSTHLVKQLMSTEKVEEATHLAESGKKIEYRDNGTERLDVCLSKDRQFIALQCFCYENYYYRKTTEVKYFEGEAAEKVSEMLGL